MISIALVIIFLVVSYIIVEYEKHIPKTLVVVNITIISIISILQVIWTVAYMLSLYLYDKSISRLLYMIAGCLTVLVIYKKIGNISYWLISNLMICRLMSFVWIQIDNSPFDGFLGSVGQWITPFAVLVINIVAQLSIWLLIRVHKWINRNNL